MCQHFSGENKWFSGLGKEKCGCNNGYAEKGPDGATYTVICSRCDGKGWLSKSQVRRIITQKKGK